MRRFPSTFGPEGGTKRQLDEEMNRGWRTHTEDLRGNRDVRDSGQHVDDHAILWEAMIYLSRHVAKIEAMLDEGDE